MKEDREMEGWREGEKKQAIVPACPLGPFSRSLNLSRSPSRRSRAWLALILFIQGLSAATGWARPLPSAGARALSLGNAYTAEDEDVNALFFNPAGLSGLSGPELSLNYGRLSSGGFSAITEGHGAYGMPASFQGIPLEAAGGFLAQSVAPGVHQFDLYGGAAAEVPTRGFVPWPVHAGGALKIRQQAGHAKDPNIGKSGFGFGLDAGARVDFNKRLALGIVLRDLFPGDVNPPGPQVRIGGRYRHRPWVRFLTDVEVRRHVTALRAGAEWSLYRDLLRLRLGNGFRSGAAGREVYHVAVGAGFNFSPTQIDVAYLVPTRTPNDPSDQVRISLVYRFNAPRFSEIYFDRALARSAELDKRVAALERREAELKAALEDLEQARRLAEEELARASVRKSESVRGLDEELVRAQARAAEAEKRVRELEGRVRDAEDVIRRAQRIAAEQKRPAPAPEAKPAVRTHAVAPGDSLRSLAEKYYSDPERWETIYKANRDKVDRGRLVPGSTLVIPE